LGQVLQTLPTLLTACWTAGAGTAEAVDALAVLALDDGKTLAGGTGTPARAG
jgi:hypothetical protein